MSHRRLLTLAITPLAAGALFCASVAPATAASTHGSTVAAQQTRGVTTTVTGTVNGVTQSGTLTITRFVREGSTLLAVGNLTLGGQNFGTVQVPVNLAQTTGACPILHLDLGPLTLNLLGLVIHLNEVVLNITAQPGPGNLLGNLLCAVAHLLDNGSLSGLSALLNQILAILSGTGL